jgi:D-3-phosphoglycerate dehydrogenase
MKILITSKSFGRYAPEALAFLEKSGFEIIRGSKPSMTPDEIAAEVHDVDALIVGNDIIDKKVIDAGTSLKLIHMNGTGLEARWRLRNAKRDTRRETRRVPQKRVAELAEGLMLVSADQSTHISIYAAGKWSEAPVRKFRQARRITRPRKHCKRVAELLSGFGIRRLRMILT